MLTNLLLEIVLLILSGLNALIPKLPLPGFLQVSSVIPSGWITAVANFLAPFIPYFPVVTVLTVIGDVLTFWPVVAGYLVFSWVWRHIPVIGGFGTGDG